MENQRSRKNKSYFLEKNDFSPKPLNLEGQK